MRLFLVWLIGLAFTAVSCGQNADPDYSDGPLNGFSGSGQTMRGVPGGGPPAAGQEVALGWMVLDTDLPTEITVIDVSLRMGEPGLEVIEGPLFWPDQYETSGIFGSLFGWPPDLAASGMDDQLPTEENPWGSFPPEPMTEAGIIVPANSEGGPGVAVLFGVRFDGSDRATIQGYTVVYEAEGKIYKEFFSSTFAICNTKECEDEEGSGIDYRPPDD